MDHQNEISTPENIRKMVLDKNLPLNPMSIYWFSFLTAAMLDFAHNGHQGATPTCLRSVLETFDPYLHTCKISETCHQVHDFLPIGDIPTPLGTSFKYMKIFISSYIESLHHEFYKVINARWLNVSRIPLHVWIYNYGFTCLRLADINGSVHLTWTLNYWWSTNYGFPWI